LRQAQLVAVQDATLGCHGSRWWDMAVLNMNGGHAVVPAEREWCGRPREVSARVQVVLFGPLFVVVVRVCVESVRVQLYADP